MDYGPDIFVGDNQPRIYRRTERYQLLAEPGRDLNS